MDPSAHTGTVATDEAAEAPFFANLGFILGIVGVLLVVTLKLSPIGFLAGVGAAAFSVLGLMQSAMQGRYARGAVAGLFCGVLVIAFWLLVRDDITSVVGGRDAWPSWML